MTNHYQNLTHTDRIDVVDALRGFALCAIVLLHNTEQYNVLQTPEWIPAFLHTIDSWLLKIMFFLFGGKAYAIFSLLFGFSFYIQIRNQERRGVDFRWRFLWRLVLLFGFGMLHSLFYPGDILILYATVGLVLVPLARVSNKALLIIAAILMLQPLEWGRIIYALCDPSYTLQGGAYLPYYHNVCTALTEGTFWDALRANVPDGVLYSNIWAAENGRFFQTASLFLFGMLLGRLELFRKSEQSLRFWRQALVAGIIGFIPLYALRLTLPDLIHNTTILTPAKILALSLSNFAFTTILASGFILLWYRGGKIADRQWIFVPFGRMSLSNYIGQSIVGASIYYAWGLGMYRYFGTTACLITGILIFAAQQRLSVWWLSRYRQGPLEYVWKKGTWLFSNRKAA